LAKGSSGLTSKLSRLQLVGKVKLQVFYLGRSLKVLRMECIFVVFCLLRPRYDILIQEMRGGRII
jgi:hypothetical protein